MNADGTAPVVNADSYDIAIVGMACRFPGANSAEEFWRNLEAGVESVSFFAPDEVESYATAEDLHDPAFVRAGAVLEDIELFDASFFNISAREAEWLDPQQRLFLECAWAAIEDAGYDVETYRGLISLYAGAATNSYLLSRLDQLGAGSVADGFQIALASEKDYLTTRVSYKLNLRGESVTVQTSCSTSLVAVHFACQSLLSGQSDIALAGGSTVQVPQKKGHFYRDGMIGSPDGHCRAFDHRAAGTVGGNGVGVVVLKRAAEAAADGDHCYAVIKGSAINNDGRAKVGFTAPSVDGQADVIAKAQAVAEVEPETIGLVEAHGTGTIIGDPIEVEALTRAFRQQTAGKGFCALGSVKTNIGHLDISAGVAGLIKATLSLKHGVIPPTLHFEKPNPALALEESPFYVNKTAVVWKPGRTPRRAGVSSFGIGGTNAHAVLEEAPRLDSGPSRRPHHLVTLSAKTPGALRRMSAELSSYLRTHADLTLPDVAFTRAVGRQAFAHRDYVVAADADEAVEKLEALAARADAAPPAVTATPPHVAFMFPGQGVQSVGMAAALYETEPVFRQHFDRCAELLAGRTGVDLRPAVYPAGAQAEGARDLSSPEFALPALLSVEYALAQLWLSWGVGPFAMLGHSFGEYTAACLAGVFSLEDALTLAFERGRLMRRLPPGAMTVVRLAGGGAEQFLAGGISLASDNGDANCVLSGPVEEIERLERTLDARKVGYRRLDVPYAYHSAAVDTIRQELVGLVRRFPRQAPTTPFISCLTGDWIEPAQAADPEYWGQQMRRAVRFGRALDTLRSNGARVFLEVGPQQSLCALARQQFGRGPDRLVVGSLAPSKQTPDTSALFAALGQLWKAGVGVNWEGVYEGERRRRVSLPTYPFERERYWIDSRLELSRRERKAPDAVGVPAAASASPEPAPRPERARHKVDRGALGSPYEAPRNEIEEALVGIWGEVLGLEGVSIHDDFFLLGGDSLLATQVFARIQKTFGTTLPLRELLAAQNIAQLSRPIQKLLLEDDDAAAEPRPESDGDYYCAFDMMIGDETVTVRMSREDYLRDGVPEGAVNVRIL